jgi:hypothetical protein
MSEFESHKYMAQQEYYDWWKLVFSISILSFIINYHFSRKTLANGASYVKPLLK